MGAQRLHAHDRAGPVAVCRNDIAGVLAGVGEAQRLTRVQGRAERSNSAALKIKLKREQALLEKMRAAYDQARNPRKASKASKAPAEDGAVL